MFCFSIVAQRPRVSPPSRIGAADGLWVPLAHGLILTPFDEQKWHWYYIMDFSTHTSGSDMAECRAPADERRQKMFRERNNHNGAKQPGSKQLCNSKDQHKRRRADRSAMERMDSHMDKRNRVALRVRLRGAAPFLWYCCFPGLPVAVRAAAILRSESQYVSTARGSMHIEVTMMQ